MISKKKKKKKVFAKIQSEFSAEIQNSNVFSAQKIFFRIQLPDKKCFLRFVSPEIRISRIRNSTLYNPNRHEAGISTICQLKIIEEVKKLVDEMKNFYKCNLNRTNSRKASKIIENFQENSLSPNCPIFSEGYGNSSSRLSYHTSQFSITIIISLMWSPKQFHPRPSMSMESQTVPPKTVNVILIHLQ